MILFPAFLVGNAQRRKKKVVEINPIELAQKEISIRNYPNAVDILNKAIAEQEKLRKPKYDVDLMQQMIDTLETNILRIRNTKRVVFIDSLVVSKKALFDAIELSNTVGKVLDATKLTILLKQNFSKLGSAAYINELNDLAYFACCMEGDKQLLYNSARHGTEWEKPKMVTILNNKDDAQDYPFMLTDGTTMYYAAQGQDSYGGWDIFVTRYDYETKTFLKSQNLGMPFNTEANDYFYVVDESINKGYFATDRHHGPDSVCIYGFIPSDVHQSYPMDESFDIVKNAAYINSIKSSQIGMELDLMKWESAYRQAHHTEQTISDGIFVINDNITYTSITEFKNLDAKAIAIELNDLYYFRDKSIKLLDKFRNQYAEQRTTTLYDNILQVEQEFLKSQKRIVALEKEMRNLEIQTLQK